MLSVFFLTVGMTIMPDAATSPDLANPFLRVTRRLTQTSVAPGVDTLQNAFDAATAGDVLVLQNGTYTGTSSDGVLVMNNKDITIRTEAGATVTIDGEGARRGIRVRGSGTIVVEGVTITNGSAIGVLNVGGGMRIDGGDVTLNNCNINDNEATYGGGGVYIDGSSTTVTFNDCNINGNTAGYYGPNMHFAGGTTTITPCDPQVSDVAGSASPTYVCAPPATPPPTPPSTPPPSTPPPSTPALTNSGSSALNNDDSGTDSTIVSWTVIGVSVGVIVLGILYCAVSQFKTSKPSPRAPQHIAVTTPSATSEGTPEHL